MLQEFKMQLTQIETEIVHIQDASLKISETNLKLPVLIDSHYVFFFLFEDHILQCAN